MTATTLQKYRTSDAWYTHTYRPYPDDILASLTALPGIGRGTYDNGIRARYFQYTPPGCTKTCSRVMRELLSASPNWPTTRTLDWAQALRNKIKSKSVSLAETIGEYKEAIGYVSGASNIMSRAWAAAKWLWRNRRYRRRIFKRLWKTGALGNYNSRGEREKWIWHDIVAMDLAIKFGIIPVTNLTYDCLERLSNPSNLKAARLQVTLRDYSERVTPGITSGHAKWRTYTSVRAIAYVTWDDLPDFTAGNPLEAIWAGTRLSFMVDWFFNVSSYLSALDAMKGIKSVRGTVTTRVKNSSEDDRINYTTGGWTVEKVAKIRAITYRRDTFGSVPLPSTINRDFDTPEWSQLLSAIEVLTSLIHGRRLNEG